MLTIGQRIAAWRRHLGLSQTALAELLGMSCANLSKIEAGKQQAKESQVASVAAALGLTMVDFYGELPDSVEAEAS